MVPAITEAASARRSRWRGAFASHDLAAASDAARLALPIATVTSKTERWWGDETTWIVERGAVTLVGALDAARLDGLASSPPQSAPEKKLQAKGAKKAEAEPELRKVTSRWTWFSRWPRPI